MNIKLSLGWFYRAAIIALAVWILHSFVQALLAACVTAIASWPLYRRFSARWGARVGSAGTSLAFTGLIVVLVLVPMIVASGAAYRNARVAHRHRSSGQDGNRRSGLALARTAGRTLLDARWQREFAHPGDLTMWTQRTDPTALLGWAQSLGQFMVRHVFIVAFTILLLFFLYQRGETLAHELRRVLRDCIGRQAERYIDISTRAVRASVNSMLLVGLFDGVAAGIAYAITGVPHAARWAAITGALAIVPFLGYVALAALALQLAMKGAGATAGLALAMGCVVLLCGDKIVRPAIADNGIRLGFVWVLMGCLGGFEALGLVGVVVGPVVISLARELWDQRVHDASNLAGCPQRVVQKRASTLGRLRLVEQCPRFPRQRMYSALREAGQRARQAHFGLWPLRRGGRTIR
jgi:predicted PurR-regulated permease PerM